MAGDDVQLAIAEIQAAIAAGQLQLARDKFNQIELPTYQNINLPSSQGAMTGVIPQNYAGGYSGQLTWDALNQLTNSRGQYLDDPRVPANLRGKNTLSRDQLELAADTQKWTQSVDTRDFNASQSNADRAFTETQRAQVQQQQAADFKMSLESGVPVVNGSPMPGWMQPHVEWVRQFQQTNGGRVPTFTDLVGQLGTQGLRPEDYNGGQPYPGTLPTAGPGIIFQPDKGYIDYAAGGESLGRSLDQYVQARIDRRTAQSPQVVGKDATGAPIYSQGATGTYGAGPGGPMPWQGQDPTAGARTANGVGQMQAGQMDYQTIGGGLPAYQGPTTNNAGQATAQIGAGTAMSAEQRRLIEQGRATDLQNQQAQNDARIREKQVEYQNAIATGNLDLANRAQTELTALNNAKLDLERQNTEFQQGIAAGTLTGDYNGQATIAQKQLNEQGRQFNAEQSGSLNGADTLAKGALLGQFNGQSTLAGQEAYGGSAYVGSGQTLAAGEALGSIGGVKTLAAQTAENQTAMQYLNLLSGLKGPENAFSYLKTLNSTPGGLKDLVDAAAGRYQMGQFGGGDQSALAPASVNGLLGGTTSAGAGQAPTAFGALPVYRGPSSGVEVSSGQWAPQNIAKMDDYQKKLLLAQREAAGEDPQAALAKFTSTLPKYAGPRRAAVRMG